MQHFVTEDWRTQSRSSWSRPCSTRFRSASTASTHPCVFAHSRCSGKTQVLEEGGRLPPRAQDQGECWFPSAAGPSAFRQNLPQRVPTPRPRTNAAIRLHVIEQLLVLVTHRQCQARSDLRQKRSGAAYSPLSPEISSTTWEVIRLPEPRLFPLMRSQNRTRRYPNGLRQIPNVHGRHNT
jgi:hypothetical protein